MLLILGTRQYPLADQFLLLGGEGLTKVLWGHGVFLINNTVKQLALLQILRVDRMVTSQVFLGQFLKIEANKIFLFRIRAMAGITLVRQNGQDLPRKVNRGTIFCTKTQKT